MSSLVAERPPAASRPTKQYKVLLISPLPPPIAGIERFGQDILESELARRHAIRPFRTNIPQSWRPRATTARATWNIVGRDGLLPALGTVGLSVKGLVELDDLCRRGRYDAVHVLSTAGYGFFRNALHIMVARRHGVRSIFHLLGQFDDLYRMLPAPMKAVMRRCLDAADCHVVQSEGLADFLRPLTTRPVYVVENGVRTDELRAPGGQARSGRGVRVVSLGRLGRRKGTYDLLDVAERMRAKHPELEWLFVGGGEPELFRNLARERGLDGFVTFAGAVDDRTRVEMLQTSDIFVLPSYAEGLPIALLEAMAAGLPVISSTVGAIPEVVKAENGIVLKAGDLDAIEAAVTKLVEDPELRRRMALTNADEAQRKYSLDRVMRDIEKIYAETIS